MNRLRVRSWYTDRSTYPYNRQIDLPGYRINNWVREPRVTGGGGNQKSVGKGVNIGIVEVEVFTIESVWQETGVEKRYIHEDEVGGLVTKETEGS